MDKLFNFLADNYIYFLIISVILLVALIGLIASNKKKKGAVVEFAAPEAQPLETPQPMQTAEPVIDNVPVSKQASNIEIDETPVSTEPIIEPTLDGYAATATDVKIDVPEEQTNETPMLIIEDKNPAPVVSENTEQPMLIIEDKPLSVESTPVVPQEPVVPVAPEANAPVMETFDITPETIAVPQEPVAPVVPEVPVAPTMPQEPTSQVVPEVPVTPVVPQEPAIPEVPVSASAAEPVSTGSIFENENI